MSVPVEAKAAQHTPGPWKYSRDRDDKIGDQFNVWSPRGLCIAATPGGLPEGTDFANARLISAAPEMPHECANPNCSGGKLYRKQQAERAEMLEALEAAFDSGAMAHSRTECIKDELGVCDMCEAQKLVETVLPKARGSK